MESAKEQLATQLTVPEIKYEVIARYPHDPGAFTEGLELHDGLLYESTGGKGTSSLRRVEPETGEVKDLISLDENSFAEGLTILNEKIFQLTWQQQVCFVYDLKTLQKVREFSYMGEGWGLTNDGHNLIMSDSTNQLRLIDPDTFEQVRNPIDVQMNRRPLRKLNELEYVQGSIYANVFPRSFIVRINAHDGIVVGQLDLTTLQPEDADVLNGIAYDKSSGDFFVTGKNWETLYKIRLKF